MIFMSRRYGWESYQGGSLPCGIIGHKNGFGLFCAASFFVTLWYSSSGEASFKVSIKKHLVLLLALLAGLVASGSKTPLGGMLLASAISLLVYWLIKMGLKDPYIIAALVFFIIVIILFGYIVNENIMQADVMGLILKPSGKDPTFTGRSDIWSTSISFGLRNNPLFGSGYGTLFVGEKSAWLQSIYGWQVWGAHNGYIETFLETGLVGLGLSLLVLAKIIGYVFKAVWKYRAHTIFLLSLVVLIIFVNFFEVNMLNTTFSFFLLLCLSVYRSLTASSRKSPVRASG
jgi:O-antigen ligase